MWPWWRGAPGSRDHRARPSPARALDEAAVGTRAEDAKPTSALVHEQPKATIAGGPKYRAGVTAAHALWVRPAARTRAGACPARCQVLPCGLRSNSWDCVSGLRCLSRDRRAVDGQVPFWIPSLRLSVTFHEQPCASDSCAPGVGRKPTAPGKETYLLRKGFIGHIGRGFGPGF